MVFHIPGWLLNPTGDGPGAELDGLLEDITLCKLLGVLPVLVFSLEHQLLSRLEADGTAYERDDSGRLVVDDTMMDLVKQEVGVTYMEVEARINRLCRGAQARAEGWDSAPFTVYSSSLLFSAVPQQTSGRSRSSCLGRVHTVDTQHIKRRLKDSDIVCLTPLGLTATGDELYVTSEELAAEVAAKLQAMKLIYFTRGQHITDTRRDTRVPTVQVSDAMALVQCSRDNPAHFDDEYAVEAMRYVELISYALGRGTRRGHLINSVQGSLLQELYTIDGSGTMISQDLFEGIGMASPFDVSGILELTEPLVKKGLLKKRSAYEVECACNDGNMFVWKRECETIGCASLERFEDAEDSAEMGCFVVAPRCRGKGHGAVLLNYIERVALLQGIKTLLLLTTQTMQWFIERGFVESSPEALPPSKRSKYDVGRSSRVYVKCLDALPSEVRERLAFVEVDTLE